MPDAQPRSRRKNVVWIAAGIGGCLALLVVVVLVVGLAWWLGRSEDRDTTTPAAAETPWASDTPASAADTDDVAGDDPVEPSTGTVTVRGRIVDAGNGAAIANAFVFLSLPTEEDPYFGVTDAQGVFEIPDLERGRAYAAEFVANGYKRAVLPEALTISPDAPAVMEMEDFPLEPE